MAVQDSRFMRFMGSATGRWFRIILGTVFVVVGWSMHSGVGTALAIFGLLPIASGVFGFCLITMFSRTTA